LSTKMGGPGTKPYQPDNVWETVGMGTAKYQQDKGENLYRRTVYNFWKRMAPPASMEILNAPNREVSCVRRDRTNTPLQALVTLNDPQFIEAARRLAESALKESGGDEAKALDLVARRILARPLRVRNKRDGLGTPHPALALSSQSRGHRSSPCRGRGPSRKGRRSRRARHLDNGLQPDDELGRGVE
ncbi:MAG TPA: DUF1553 domain-containing protein, partial [Bacteroidia bacterium]|nr:DUF1553 domain-containing protein [Bacteroidia bacterium]